MSVISTILDKITEYLRVKGEALKLDIISRVSILLAHVVAFIFVGIIVLFLFVFLSLALSAYLNEILESHYMGYLMVSGFYLLILIIIVILLRTNRIQRWLESLFISITENINTEDE